MKMLKPFLLFCTILFIISCRKEVTPEQSAVSESTQSRVNPEHLQAAWLLGFDTAGARYLNDGLLVGGDVLMDKQYLENLLKAYKASSANERHAHTASLVTGNNTNITVSLQDNLINTYSVVLALQGALSHLNAVSDCRLNFMYASNDANADIKIYRSYDFNSYAYAFWPTGNGQPGSKVYFNLDLANGRTQGQNVLLFVHEIGHCLGLRHADWDNIGEPVAAYDDDWTYGGATYIPGTPTYDASSVMNHDIGILGLSWSSFSTYDIVALRYLYPLEIGTVFESYINGPVNISQAGQHNHSNGAAYSCGNYEWRLLNASAQVIYDFWDEECSGLEWSNILSPGTYYLEARLKNTEAPGVWYSKAVNVQ